MTAYVIDEKTVKCIEELIKKLQKEMGKVALGESVFKFGEHSTDSCKYIDNWKEIAQLSYVCKNGEIRDAKVLGYPSEWFIIEHIIGLKFRVEDGRVRSNFRTSQVRKKYANVLSVIEHCVRNIEGFLQTRYDMETSDKYVFSVKKVA
jgi:hypothetical protein